MKRNRWQRRKATLLDSLISKWKMNKMKEVLQSMETLKKPSNKEQ